MHGPMHETAQPATTATPATDPAAAVAAGAAAPAGRDGRFDPTRAATANRPQNDGTSMDDVTSRLDGVAKVDGSARYGRDVMPEDVVYARFIRCPYGRGRLASADEAAARAVPGVLVVRLDAREGDFHGRRVGVLAAETPRALDRGMRALAVRWEVAGAVDRGIEDRAFDDPTAAEARGGVGDALAEADVVVEAVYTTPVQTHVSIETHGAVVIARPDGATGWISTQGVQAAADGLARALDVPRASTEVIAEYVGGGFGSKIAGADSQGVEAARLARELGRPVWLFLDREEEHLDSGNRPSSRAFVRIGATRDGRILGGQIRTAGDTGVGRRGGGVDVPSGRYDLGALDRDHRNVPCNAGPPRPMRAPGKPQGAWAEEMLLDELAAACGLDPVELRLRNERSDARRRMYEDGARRIGWERRRPNGEQTGTIVTGYGVGSTNWGAFPSRGEAEVVINPDGSVVCRQGAQDIGTGQRTVMGVCCAEALGIPLDRVTSEVGRSSLPYGPMSGGSVTLTNTAPAMEAAAADAKARLIDALVDREGGAAEDYDVADGRVLRGGEPFMDWDEACRLLPRRVTGTGSYAGGRRSGGHPGTGHSDGVQFVRATVDRETGVVTVDHVVALQACGRIVCRKTAESQVIGGVIQGVSFALFEERVLDRVTGAMVNPNMEWYRILGSKDMPRIEPVLWDDGGTGVRPLGEPPVIPTAGAVGGAVANALGVPIRSLPLRPDRILAALAARDARDANAAPDGGPA